MNHLLNMLDGFASILDWGPSSQRYRRMRGGFQRDQRALREDALRVAGDLKKVTLKYGEQVGSGSSYEQKR